MMNMKQQMASSDEPGARPDQEQLSALMDGELPGEQTGGACRAIGRDAVLRADWAAYHLIGDCLRSAELAQVPDDAFVLRLRQRLAHEPVVLAPAPAAAPTSRRWAAPVAAVAGVAMVAGTLFVVAPRTSNPGSQLSDASQRVDAGAVALAASSAVGPTPLTLVRDAQLDRYLAAHKQFVGVSALGSSSGFLRASTLDGAPAR